MEEYMGTVQAFAFGFAPRGWATCNGQLLPISQNSALFSLIGTTYGGDGRTTFGLPDLRGHALISQGASPGFSNRLLGQKGGTETNTLNSAQLASHTHATVFNGQDVNAFVGVPVVESPASTDVPSAANVIAQSTIFATSNPAKEVNLAPFNAPIVGTSTSNTTGDGAAINNMQPFLTLNYCICLDGPYPPRN